MVGFGLDYACAHIIIPASVLPIQADFVTERDIESFVHRVTQKTKQHKVMKLCNNVMPRNCTYLYLGY